MRELLEYLLQNSLALLLGDPRRMLDLLVDNETVGSRANLQVRSVAILQVAIGLLSVLDLARRFIELAEVSASGVASGVAPGVASGVAFGVASRFGPAPWPAVSWRMIRVSLVEAIRRARGHAPGRPRISFGWTGRRPLGRVSTLLVHVFIGGCLPTADLLAPLLKQRVTSGRIVVAVRWPFRLHFNFLFNSD